MFLVISSSSLSLLCCFLPWDSVPTLLAPGSVLCYRNWLERAGPWTCPKPLQKTHHPCNFPFAHSQLSLPLASSLAASEGVPGNEHKTNPGYHSTFFFFCEKNCHLWAQKLTVGLSGSAEKGLLCQPPWDRSQPPWHHHTWPPCLQVCFCLWSFYSFPQFFNPIRATLSCFLLTSCSDCQT